MNFLAWRGQTVWVIIFENSPSRYACTHENSLSSSGGARRQSAYKAPSRPLQLACSCESLSRTCLPGRCRAVGGRCDLSWSTAGAPGDHRTAKPGCKQGLQNKTKISPSSRCVRQAGGSKGQPLHHTNHTHRTHYPNTPRAPSPSAAAQAKHTESPESGANTWASCLAKWAFAIWNSNMSSQIMRCVSGEVTTQRCRTYQS